MSCSKKMQASSKNSLTEEQKRCFFRLLKKMLQTPSSLQNGEEAQDQCDGKTLSLTYWMENCQVVVLNASGQTQFSKRLPVQGIYLQYGEGLIEETLSAESLQHVQNDLRLLGIQSKEILACFSLAKTKFTEELQCLQKSMILKIICDDIILSFLSGEGKNLATVLYDSNLDKPVYNINVANWWIRMGRWFWVVMCELGSTSRAFSDLLSATESLMKSLTLLVKSLHPTVNSLNSFIHSKLSQHDKLD